MDYLNFSLEEYKEFKELYEHSVKSGIEQFQFQGLPVLTSFAKYVIEYLEQNLKTV